MICDYSNDRSWYLNFHKKPLFLDDSGVVYRNMRHSGVDDTTKG